MLDLSPQRELPTVLLIDDDLVSREVIATLLTMSGFTVHSAESGDAAMDLLAEGAVRPGVVLMDAQMPGLSGMDLIARLRESCSHACVYLISGSAPGADLVAAADGMLLKPFHADALRKLVEGHADQIVASRLDPQEAVVSLEVLRQLRQLMPESAVREIYVAVVADLGRRIEALGAAIARHDAAEIRRIGHAIKGGCGMAGAQQAARLGALLEAAAGEVDDNHLDNSRMLLRDLRSAVRGLQRILDSQLPA
jgi:CheY-like chemotaxis protein